MPHGPRTGVFQCRMLRLMIGALLMCTGELVAQAQPATLPTYDARRASDAIRVDGVLDEATWALSPRVGPLRLIHTPDRTPTFPTEVAVTWDESRLYVAFACTDAEPWARQTARDARLWEEEVVEVFLDPDGDGRQYAEIEVSPTNVVVDLLIAAPRAAGPGARSWNAAGLETAVGRHAGGWIAEIAIPWAALAEAGVTAAPVAGTQWRVGLYRIKRPGGVTKAARIDALVAERRAASEERKTAIEQELLSLRADDEYSAWSLTQAERGFHDPERFGIVRFTTAGR
jgi:hypothetical protein